MYLDGRGYGSIEGETNSQSNMSLELEARLLGEDAKKYYVQNAVITNMSTTLESIDEFPYGEINKNYVIAIFEKPYKE